MNFRVEPSLNYHISFFRSKGKQFINVWVKLCSIWRQIRWESQIKFSRMIDHDEPIQKSLNVPCCVDGVPFPMPSNDLETKLWLCVQEALTTLTTWATLPTSTTFKFLKPWQSWQHHNLDNLDNLDNLNANDFWFWWNLVLTATTLTTLTILPTLTIFATSTILPLSRFVKQI